MFSVKLVLQEENSTCCYSTQDYFICEGNCPEENCTDHYIGEIARRIFEKMMDLKKRDRNSHIFKHNCNLGQNIIDKPTKLSKTGFSMKCLTDHFSQFSTQLFFVCLSISSISGIF